MIGSQFVVTEEQLFKHLVHRIDIPLADLQENMQKFLHRIPQNIFKDEYHILYECIEQANKYGIVLNYDYLHQILLNNMDGILHNPAVTLYKNNDITEVDRQQLILDHVLSAMDELSEIEVLEDSPLHASMEFYIETWCKEYMEIVVQNQLTILREGLTVGRRQYQGVEDSKAYYEEAYNIIRSLQKGEGDLISETIDTSTMVPDDVRAMLEEESDADIVSRFGINALDEHYQLRKGEIVTIQAGTGVGKTRVANGMVFNSLEMGKNVLYLTLEQRSVRVWAMQQARNTLQLYGYKPDVTDKSILNKSYNVENTAAVNTALDDLFLDERKGRLRLESINLAAGDLPGKLKSVWENGFHFDVVVIDYLGLLLTKGMSRYEALTDVVNDIKSDVKSFKGVGFLAVVLNQLTKEAEQKILAGNFSTGKTEGSETQYLGRASDYIYTLLQTPDDKLANKMQFLVDKVRLGEAVAPRVDAIAYMGQCYFADYTFGNTLRPAS